jgi:copper(I)-binding protein
MKSLATLMFTGCALCCAAVPAHAQKIDPAPPAITDAWVRTTVPGGTVSAAYMHIKSTKPLRLVKAESPVAGLVELHNMTMKDGVMGMKAMDAVDIPADKMVELKPGAMHVMLMMVKQPIKAGDKVPLILTFEAADKKPVVIKLDAVAQEKGPSGHMH